jgi:gamma-glutamylcyclotransferase (GGCT)/AIG2-like uncharacterized protein YtfP
MRKRNELIFSLVIPIIAKIDELMVTFYAVSGIFAYGTLQGLEHGQPFGGIVERLDEVKIRGHLYDLGRFPGWRYQTWGFVHGCLLQVPLASRLDFLQFCDGIEGEVFQRRLVLAFDNTDRTNDPKHIAWAYHYREEPQSSQRIMDGIWRGSNKGGSEPA